MGAVMTERFEKMTKIPALPTARMLAEVNTKLSLKLDAPASAPTDAVLAELDAKGKPIDMLRVLSIVLPPRERVWWACLAARDFVGPAPDNNTPSLEAAEAWVFRPSPENREKLMQAIDMAEPDDETVKCALSAIYAEGSLGPGELDDHPAPPGGSEVMAFAVNVIAMDAYEGDFEAYTQELVDRAVDIARGGNGRVKVEAEKEG